ncbi:hypothetical protein RvY_09118 [Ramazzottius varieornatus]|uniref:Negative elongation factor B n=1 Tax=Ramazzottius varieornatus TaxID=947166 RepID=A0A1D1VAQ4_RAMVA|nr:hypothetical protein RvY_09118 [Ramazzottius varieornatus]
MAAKGRKATGKKRPSSKRGTRNKSKRNVQNAPADPVADPKPRRGSKRKRETLEDTDNGRSGSKKRNEAPQPTQLVNGKNNLEDVYGLRGSRYLHSELTTCNDPQVMLEQFRIDEGVLVPTLKPAVALLDLMDITRSDFHHSCVSKLKQELLDKIAVLSKQQTAGKSKPLDQLLDKCFTGLKLPLIRPIVLSVLKSLHSVEDRYKEEIIKSKELYDVCDIALRRQIWLDRKDIFEAETLLLIDEYIANRVRSMYDVEPSKGLYTVPGNVRRQDPAALKIVENVGDTVPLYIVVNKLLHERYQSTGIPHYGTLRLDLLILFHERQPQLIDKQDGVLYKFAYCIDACVRARHVDPKRRTEITEVLDSIKKKHIDIFREIALLLADPQVTYFSAHSAVRLVQAVVNQNDLPRDNNMLLFFLRLINISTHSKEYFSGTIAKENKNGTVICCEFLPRLCSVMVSAMSKLITGHEKLKKAVVGVQTLLPHLQKEPVAVWLIIQWIAYLLRSNEQELVMELFRLFPQFVGEAALKDNQIVHNILVILAQTAQEHRWSVPFADCVFREYLGKITDPVSRALHILRLMYHVYPKLESSYREQIFADFILQVEDTNVAHLFETVSARIATSVPVSLASLSTPTTPSLPSDSTHTPFRL